MSIIICDRNKTISATTDRRPPVLSKEKIIDKLKDSGKKEKDFKWKILKHNSNDLDCLHCKYLKAENSLKDKIKDMKDTDTTKYKDKSGVETTHTFKLLKVFRGRHDDVIGWSISWQ